MNIVKKKAESVIVGDILIIDYLECGDKLTLSSCMGKKGIKAFEKKFEGETQILLYEVDDIDIDYSFVTFYHIEELKNGMPDLIFPVEYELDVIENPWWTLQHYNQEQ